MLLAYGRGLTAQEIAAATGIPLGTAKSRVRLGLRKARESLQATEGLAGAPRVSDSASGLTIREMAARTGSPRGRFACGSPATGSPCRSGSRAATAATPSTRSS